MAKKAFEIEAFEGGINQKADPRDVEDNQFEELFNADVSKKGRIVLPGNALSVYSTVNIKSETVFPNGSDLSLDNESPGLTPGYGLFTFSHDYNMQSLEDSESGSPDALETEFLCINDGAHIDIWDSCHFTDGTDLWIQSAVKLGNVHIDSNDKKVKPVYYKVGNGLRVCDANFSEGDTGIDTNEAFSSTDTTLTTSSGINQKVSVGEYIRIDSEIMKVIVADSLTAIDVKRAQFGTIGQEHATGTDIYILNLPKILSHIKRPMLEKANTAGATIDTWKEDVQALEPPNDYSTPGLTVFDGSVTAIATSGTTGTEAELHCNLPNTPEKVLLSIHESTSADDKVINCNKYETGTVLNGVSTIKITATSSTADFPFEGFTIGKFVIIKDSGTPGIDGLSEIVGIGATNNIIFVSGEYPIGEDADGETEDANISLQLEENRISEDLQNKYIFGISYLYEGGGSEMQESAIRTGYLHSGKIEHRASAARTYTGWYRDNTLDDFTNLLDDASSSSWNIEGGDVFFDDSDAGDVKHLAYIGGEDLAAGNYFIAIDVKMGADASLTIYPPGKDGTSTSSGGTIGDGTSDGTSVVIDTSGIYLFKAKAETTNGVLSRYFVCKASNPNGAGDIHIQNIQVFAETPTIMSASNAIDMRGWESIPKMFSSFNMNKHSDYKWNERISGYKIYMKQVDSASTTLSSEWLLALKVDFETGEYVNHTNDNVEQTLTLGDSWDIDDNSSDATVTSSFIASLVTTTKTLDNTQGKSAMDTMRNIPLDTYQSENGYEAETNTAVMYKTAATINRKMFIGNLKIGGKTYPDRMIEAPVDRFDTFPDDGLHYIDVAVGDGDEIVKLEALGDKLIQFKKKHAYAIQVSSEGVELLHTWTHSGIKMPCQSVVAKGSVIWVNDNGLYVYDGEKLNYVTADRFTSENWSINESEDNPVIIGYDEQSDKILIQTTNTSASDNGGFIYDLKTDSIVQCQNLFNWYVADEAASPDKVGPPLAVVGSGTGPII